MDFNRLNIGNKKNKGKGTASARGPRTDNWTEGETGYLLDIIEDIQTRRGSDGFNFTKQEYHEIVVRHGEKYKSPLRDESNLKNRIKVLKERFKVCDELVNRSGGDWDDKVKRPTAASPEEYIEMVQAYGPKAQFLMRGMFDYYLRMVTMGGGKTSNSDVCKRTTDVYQGDAAQVLLLPGPSTNRQSSQQGSSDEPDEFPNDSTDTGSVRQPGSSSRTNRPGRSKAGSGSSGGKKRSTDTESGEEVSRGKRKTSRRAHKALQLGEIVEAGFAIADVLREGNELRLKKQSLVDQSLQILQDMNLPYDVYQVCLRQLRLLPDMRKWLVRGTALQH